MKLGVKHQIFQITGITPPQSAWICKFCQISLDHACQFRAFVIETDRKLKSMDGVDGNTTKPVQQQISPVATVAAGDPFHAIDNEFVAAIPHSVIKNEPILDTCDGNYFYEPSINLSDDGEDVEDDNQVPNQNYIPLRNTVAVKEEDQRRSSSRARPKRKIKVEKMNESSSATDDIGGAKKKGLNCAICSKYIQGGQYHLNRHLSACGVPPHERKHFKCQHCPKDFTRQDKLRDHLKKVHDLNESYNTESM